MERKDIIDLYSPNRDFSAFKWLAKGLTDLRGVCRHRDHEGKSAERLMLWQLTVSFEKKSMPSLTQCDHAEVVYSAVLQVSS